MIAKVNSCALLGIDGFLITVEADSSSGIPSIDMVGLPDATIKESKERIKSAIKNSGYEFPPKRIIINLAPADIKKEGAYFDLPITIAILSSLCQIDTGVLEDYLIIGELALDGSLRNINGVLPMTIEAAKQGIKNVIVPRCNAYEASVVESVNVYGASDLTEVVSHLTGDVHIKEEKLDLKNIFINSNIYEEDFADVKGQDSAKRALEVSAAGAHNCLMIGAPGSGKTMLSRRIPTILPDLTFEESLEITKIYSIAGRLPANTPLITTRPFRSPHHTISSAGLISGGTIPKPGEFSLAHRGVLFLDELPEFRRDSLESMRQPLEDGFCTVVRVHSSVTFPCSIMLVASMNPCKCGYYGDNTRECTCTPSQIQKYIGKISGPMLDRFDIHIEVPTAKYSDLSSEKRSESSLDIKKRVNMARQIQLERYKGKEIYANSQLGARDMEIYCHLNNDCKDLLEQVFEKLGLSARAHSRIIKVARTRADLDESDNIDIPHMAEAIQYRSMDKKFWFN